MPPPDEKTEPISGSELLETPPGKTRAQDVRPPMHVPVVESAKALPASPAHVDPRLALPTRVGDLSRTVPLGAVFAKVPAVTGPALDPRLTGPLGPRNPAERVENPGGIDRSVRDADASTPTPRLTTATKILLALLVVLVVAFIGVFGKRPRHGNQASRVSAAGLAAGTSSPEPKGLALLTR